MSTATISSLEITANLLAELEIADQIIHIMLNCMTAKQKSKTHVQLEASGISDTGVMRSNERGAEIESVRTALEIAHQAAARKPRTAIDDVIAMINSAVDATVIAESFANSSIFPVMDSLGSLAEIESADVGQLRLRLGLIRDLAKVGCQLVNDMACAMELEGDNLRAARTELKGGSK
jgi:hypothetical protein